MSVVQTKSNAAKPAASRSLNARLDASIAEHPAYKFSDEVLKDLDDLSNVTALDLKGMADALWCMSYGDGGTTGMCGGGMHEGLQWVERELARKAEHIQNVVSRVSREIHSSRLNDGRGRYDGTNPRSPHRDRRSSSSGDHGAEHSPRRHR